MDRRSFDYMLIGAQKCATSWLYYCFRDHPEICVPTKKLEKGYIGGNMFEEMGEDWFFDRFHPSDNQRVGDISVEYLWDENAAAAMKPFASDAKFIISLRHPVDRTVSGYFWLLRKGDIENRPLEDGLGPILDAQPGFSEPIEGPLGQAVGRSLYGPQIQRFIDLYGAERIKVVLYEQIAAAGLQQVQDLYSYLGVRSDFRPPSLGSAPKRNSYNNWLLAIESSTKSKAVAKLCNYAHQALTTVSSRKDIVPAVMRSQLNALFEPAVAETLDVLRQLPADQRPSDDALSAHWMQGRH
ncbi:MAG: hypothetical protein AAF739_09095 [Pseudomonadota bacterium]